MWNRSILVLAMTLLVAACGGGGGGSNDGSAPAGGNSGGGTSGGGSGAGGDSFNFDTGIGGSGGIFASIDGFGSIIFDDLTLNTDGAEFYIEGEPGFSQDDLREGQYVVVAGDISGLIALISQSINKARQSQLRV